MEYEKIRKNNILLPDLVIDNRVCIPIGAQESIEPKRRHSDHSVKANQQFSNNISPVYLLENSPNHGSQPMSLPSSLPESPSREATQYSGIALASQTIETDQKLKRPSQFTGEIGELRSIYEIPPKYRSIFSNYPSFNVIQSKALDILLYTDRPLVISAPTGSGKTVIFELAIVNLLIKLNEMNYRGDYKIVYMAPVKALCTERYHDWQEKFVHLGLKCHEVTGDSDDSSIAELHNYNLVLTTPEKWDSLTRKWKQNKQLVQLVKLFLIDEVHLLSEERRGPVLEAVVSRMKTIQETLSYSKHSSSHNCGIKIPIRFIAVSATIPNIEDLADWLGDGLRPAEFIKIGEEYRPVKLTKVVLGFPTSLKQNPFMFDMNLSYRLRDLLFKYAEGKPTLIFCSTRKGVTQTAQTLAKEITFHFSEIQRESLMLAANNLVDKKLRDTVLSGVGSHHAGMDLHDRHTTEDLFRRLLLPVLVTTSTLAMGVNLPAHLVIVKSTQQYISGIYQDYSETQMLQMIGRAGRPQFDKTATAIIMTRQQDKNRYERLVEGKDLIESTLHRHLAEHLNAEVVLETITDVCIAMNWLRSTFLFVRALKNPGHYGFAKGLSETEITKKLQDLCLYEMNGLASANLVTVTNGLDIRPTDNGRLMAGFYLSLETMKIFNKITGMESMNDMILVVASCHEFSELQLRRVEKRVLNELNKIKDRECIRFPIKGVVKDIPMKVNVLTQATFGCLPINDPSLYQDSLKIVRVGERISRCLRKYLLNAGHYKSLLNTALLAKCYFSKLWEDSIYVTKQLPGIGAAYSNLLASAGKTTFQSILVANPRDLERILNKAPPLGNELKKAVIHLPKYKIEMNLNTIQNEGTMTLQLENIEDITSFPTAGLNHWLTIIVGDNTNSVIHSERLNDNQILQMEGEVSWSFSISSNVNEIYGHVISDQWVGIDANITVAVQQKGFRPGNILMKKVIEQYVSKMGIPNPLVNKKEAVKTTKPVKLTIVEQIRQKGRQLPELGVKIGNKNVNIPTPLKQSSLDRFLYTPAKRLKLPSTYAEFINENASAEKVINKHDFIQNLLPSNFNNEQRQTQYNQDSSSKECQPPTRNSECDDEYDGRGKRHQSSQEIYFQNTQPNQQEQHRQCIESLNQNCYGTQEGALDDVEATEDHNLTDWGVGLDRNHQLPQHTRSDYMVGISSEDEDSVKWAKTYELDEQEVQISEPGNPRTRGASDFAHEREDSSSQIIPHLQKEQQVSQREYWKSLDGNSTLEKPIRSLPSYFEINSGITMQPENSENVSKRGLPNQNCRQTLPYPSCNKESTETWTTSYSETQSDYLQRMKRHFADFEVINKNCVKNSNDEKNLCSGHIGKIGGNQSSQAHQIQGTQEFEVEENRQFSVPFGESDSNTEDNELDYIYKSQRQDGIPQNDISQKDYQYNTDGEQEKYCFDPEKENSDDDNDLPIPDTQLLQETYCNAKFDLVNGSSNEPRTSFTDKLKNCVIDCKDDYKYFEEHNQEYCRTVGEEKVISCKNFTQPIQDGPKHTNGCMLDTYEADNQHTGSNTRDITDRLEALTQNEENQNSEGFFLASSPDQRTKNISVMKSLQKNDIGEVEVGRNQAGVLPHEHGGGYGRSNTGPQEQSGSKINILESKDSSDVLYFSPESKFNRENDPVKNPFGDSLKITCTSEEKRTETASDEKSEVPTEYQEIDVFEDNVGKVNESETHCGKFHANNMLGVQFMKRDELSSKTEIFGRDQSQEKPNIPKHHFPIFMSYDLSQDQNFPNKQQEKLNFKFFGNNCNSPEAANNSAIPKIIFDPSINNLETRETNISNAGNPDPILNSVKAPKLKFDFDIDSLLDSIDSADIGPHESYKKGSQNMSEMPVRNQKIKKYKPDIKKNSKRDWDANDPLMVLFYGPRKRKTDHQAQMTDCTASSEILAKPTVLADHIFGKPCTTNQTQNSEDFANCDNVSFTKGNNEKSAPLKTLFPYCKGQANTETKLSSSRINLQNNSKTPKISTEIKDYQPTNQSEQKLSHDKTMPTENPNLNIEKSLPLEMLNSKNTKYPIQQRKCPQQTSRQNDTFCDLPQPSTLNFNHPEIAPNMKSFSNESFKSAATTDCNNKEGMKAQITERHTVDAHKSDNLHKELGVVIQTKQLPAIGRTQHFQGEILKSLPSADVNISNGRTQSCRHTQRQEHVYDKTKIENLLSNVPVHRKVSAYEQVVTIRQANSSWKDNVGFSKLTQQNQLVRNSFHKAHQTSHRYVTEDKEHISTTTDKTYLTQEGSLKLSGLASCEQPQFTGQYSRQSNCNFEETSGGKYLQSFDYQMGTIWRQTKSGNTQVNYPSPEQTLDIDCSPSSKCSEGDGNDYGDYGESRFKWLASQNTFTQRSDVDGDLSSSNENESRFDSKLRDGDNAFGNMKSQNSQQCSIRPWNSDADNNTFTRVDDLEEQDDLSESDIPLVPRKFEYNHTQTPRCVSTSSNKRMPRLWENIPYDTSSQHSESRHYDNSDREEISSENLAEDRGEPRYHNVFEQAKNSQFQVSPFREPHDERSESHLATSSYWTNVERDSFCDRTKQPSPISYEPRKDFGPFKLEQDDKWSRNNKFHQLYESEDFDKYLKNSGDCAPRNYNQESASFCAVRSEDTVNFNNRQREQPPVFASEALSESRFHHNPAEKCSSKTPKPIQRQNMFQYCQKRTPGIIDAEFNQSKTKHRRHF